MRFKATIVAVGLAVGLTVGLAVGLGACASSSSKSAASTTTTTSATKKPTAALEVSPDSGLVNMQTVSVTGSGFTAGSPGNMLECNADPKQPTVALPAPVNSTVSVGCSAPSTSALATTTSTGTLSTTYKIVQGTVGPPCGSSGALVAQCPATDSTGTAPAADAAAYPCPPTPTQQAAGISCVLTFGDAAGETASSRIAFSG